MLLSVGHKRNFNTLRRAFRTGEAALMECQLAATGETAAVICAVNRLPDDQFELVPIATLFPGNPYEAVSPPNPSGGFCSQVRSEPSSSTLCKSGRDTKRVASASRPRMSWFGSVRRPNPLYRADFARSDWGEIVVRCSPRPMRQSVLLTPDTDVLG
jgi:hypothetical protein